jgi:sec-independent protein translocase protein TatA
MTGLLEHIAFISMPGGGEWIILLVVGLLIFGRRLPEVARSLGKSVNEFKKGMREFQDSADEVVRDVKQATSDVASEVNDASGMNDYGYYEPSPPASEGEQYEVTGSGDTSDDVNHYGAPESTDTTAEATEGAHPEIEEAPPKQSEHDPHVEPMK